jgi:hypothetical protein
MGRREIVDCKAITEAVFGCLRSYVAENQKSECFNLNVGTTINRRRVVVF